MRKASKSQIKYLLLLGLIASSCNPKSESTSSAKAGSTSLKNGGGPGAQFNASTNPKVSQIIALKAQIEERRPQLERAKDIRGKLMLELMANIGAGCMGDTKPNTIEIIVDGQQADKLDVSATKEADQYLPEATAGVTNFEFYIGDMEHQNFVSFNNNEAQTPIFAPNGHFVFQVDSGSNFKLSQAQMISIKKSSAAYTKTDFCGTGKSAVSGCSMEATINEVERYQLNSLSVKVNGLMMYTNPGVHHMFSLNPGPEGDAVAKTKGLTWSDNNAQLNPAYITLMQNTQCAPN